MKSGSLLCCRHCAPASLRVAFSHSLDLAGSALTASMKSWVLHKVPGAHIAWFSVQPDRDTHVRGPCTFLRKTRLDNVPVRDYPVVNHPVSVVRRGANICRQEDFLCTTLSHLELASWSGVAFQSAIIRNGNLVMEMIAAT